MTTVSYTLTPPVLCSCLQIVSLGLGTGLILRMTVSYVLLGPVVAYTGTGESLFFD